MVYDSTHSNYYIRKVGVSMEFRDIYSFIEHGTTVRLRCKVKLFGTTNYVTLDSFEKPKGDTVPSPLGKYWNAKIDSITATHDYELVITFK